MRGWSRWSDPVVARTKLEPKDGGAFGPGYIWSQSATDVVLTLEVDMATTARQLSVYLTPTLLRVAIKSGKENETLLDGTLCRRVRMWDDGSFWELSKEDGKKFLVITLEKEERSISTKFDYWKSVIKGHQEVDTHMIDHADSGKENAMPFSYQQSQIEELLGDGGLKSKFN